MKDILLAYWRDYRLTLIAVLATALLVWQITRPTGPPPPLSRRQERAARAALGADTLAAGARYRRALSAESAATTLNKTSHAPLPAANPDDTVLRNLRRKIAGH